MSHNSETEAVIPELLPEQPLEPAVIKKGKDLLVPIFRLLKSFSSLKLHYSSSFLLDIQLKVRNIRTIFHHEMVTVEQTLAVKPVERLPLFLKKAGLDPG